MILKGKTVYILIADGYHEHEFWFPYYRFREEGANVIVAAPNIGTVYGEGRHGKDGLEAIADTAISDLSDKTDKLPDILFLPGGIYGPLSLRAIPKVQNYVRNCMDAGKLICSICHAPWILISAGVLKGKTVSAPGDIAPDIIGAGGNYSSDKVTLDRNLLTAQYFACLPEMFQVMFTQCFR